MPPGGSFANFFAKMANTLLLRGGEAFAMALLRSPHEHPPGSPAIPPPTAGVRLVHAGVELRQVTPQAWGRDCGRESVSFWGRDGKCVPAEADLRETASKG